MPDKQLFANNASTVLADPLGATDTYLDVAAGKGALFPVPAAGEYFLVTIEDPATGDFEIVKVTSRSIDTFSIQRAQEQTGTGPGLDGGKVFSAGAIVELRVTRDTLSRIRDLALGAGAAATSYTFNTPLTTWSITHALGRYVGVRTYDGVNPATSNEIVGDVQYVDENNIDIVFSEPVTGIAYII